VRLNHITLSFDEPKPETVASRWNRVSLNKSFDFDFFYAALD
jgi:hypothetical protein